jgi:hypothetical protein
VAEVLKSSLRKNDFPARYGGDEFTVIAPDTNTEQSQKLAEKLRSRIENHNFGAENLKITISVGFTIYRPGETLQNFIRRADLALYDAKQMGRNIACFRDPWLIDDEDVAPSEQKRAAPPASKLAAETEAELGLKPDKSPLPNPNLDLDQDLEDYPADYPKGEEEADKRAEEEAE